MKPNCKTCKHYFITYEPSTPNGCKVYGIKSRQIPSIEVKKANDGAECIGHEHKPKKQESKKSINLNDDSLW